MESKLQFFNSIQQNLPPTLSHKSVLGNHSDITVALCLQGKSLSEWEGACLSTAYLFSLKLSKQKFSVALGVWKPVFSKTHMHVATHGSKSTCPMTSPDTLDICKHKAYEQVLCSLLRRRNLVDILWCCS